MDMTAADSEAGAEKTARFATCFMFPTALGSNSVRYYVFGEVVGFLRLEASDVISCPLVSEWGPASSCLLQPVAYFAGCLDSPEPACVITPQAWVLDCSPGAPDCG